MIFKYKGIGADGKKTTGHIEATSLQEAKNKLRASNILYSEIKEDSVSFFDSFSLKRAYKITPKELAILSRELATYIRSGVSIVAALKIVATHYKSNKKLKLFLETLTIHLDEGENLYRALISQDVVTLPPFYVESIRVSENGGILDEVLLELSRFLKEQEKLQKEIKSAFAYPMFMIFVSLGMIAFMLTFVVPQITAIFTNLDQELPRPTQIVIALGEFFSSNFLLLLIVFTVFVVLFMLLRRFSEGFAYSVDRLILKLPLFGEIVRKSELARFSYMAALLTRSGVVFVQTINMSAKVLQNRVIKRLFLDASERVVEGKLLSDALQRGSIKIDETFVQALALAEETSEIQSVLENISELYFEENRDKIALLLTLLEPALMLFVGGSIGFIVAAMLLPIFSMSIT
ncbi:MAG TPA: type II secretion system F family protein [Sulfurimonas autotrophica]|nr:type II secretion system F family protein [Sulfurimonas autotrophica]